MGLINIWRCQCEWGSLRTQELRRALSFKADCTYQRRSKDLPRIKSHSRPSSVLLVSDLPQTKILILSVKFKFGHCASQPHDAAEISWTDAGKSLANITDSLLFLFRASLKPQLYLWAFKFPQGLSWRQVSCSALESDTQSWVSPFFLFVRGEDNYGLLTSRENANCVTVL